MRTDKEADCRSTWQESGTDHRDVRWKQRFRRGLLRWFARSARDLPWRPSPGIYETWVSEIMLQQTQVATVVPYFQRFVTRFPTVEALARADEQDVLRLWEGLGYYRRARQLHAAARRVMTHFEGHIPTTVEQLQSLPGIGRYTAGAILSIALDQPQPILEANTTRVLSRILAMEDDPTRSFGRNRLWSFAESLLPRRRAGDFNQALMELGSSLCTPRDPACLHCPVVALCEARQRGLQEQIPRRQERPAYEARREAAVVIRHHERVLVRQCGATERWAGLWDFPRFPVDASRGRSLPEQLVKHVAQLTGVTISPGRRIATIKHTVTRFRITLLCHEAICTVAPSPGAGQRWVRTDELAELPLSVTGRKISQLIAPRHGGGGNDSDASAP